VPCLRLKKGLFLRAHKLFLRRERRRQTISSFYWFAYKNVIDDEKLCVSTERRLIELCFDVLRSELSSLRFFASSWPFFVAILALRSRETKRVIFGVLLTFSARISDIVSGTPQSFGSFDSRKGGPAPAPVGPKHLQQRRAPLSQDSTHNIKACNVYIRANIQFPFTKYTFSLSLSLSHPHTRLNIELSWLIHRGRIGQMAWKHPNARL